MLSQTSPRVSPYRVLGVGPGVSGADLKAAYRKMALKLHPDVNPGADHADAERAFRDLTDAYEHLNSAGGNPRQMYEWYGEAFPSMFWEVLGVRKQHSEGTLDHVQRAMMIRLYGEVHTEAYEKLNVKAETSPSMFWEVLGVRKQHSEGTLSHVQRALMLRLFQVECRAERLGSAT
jgi:uncharacterized protein (DUF1810 family)